MANLLNVIDTLYQEGDLIIAKFESCKDVSPILIEHTTKTNGSNGVMQTWIICGAIVAIAFITAITLIWFHCSRRRNERRQYLNECRENCRKQLLSCLKDDNESYIAELRNCLKELDKGQTLSPKSKI